MTFEFAQHWKHMMTQQQSGTRKQDDIHQESALSLDSANRWWAMASGPFREPIYEVVDIRIRAEARAHDDPVKNLQN